MAGVRVVEEQPAEHWRRLRRLPMGTELEITRTDGRVWRGLLVPPHEFSGERVIQLKLPSGYNVGLKLTPQDRIDVVGRVRRSRSRPARVEGTVPEPDTSRPAEPWVALLTTGGTIASRVDYRTGGVKPVHDEREILSFFPALDAEGPVRVRTVFERFSEDIGVADWIALAQTVGESFSGGARGVVIAHGTDTLAFTAAALSFLIENPPGPVVLVGAQRSPDRPSSDGFTNLPAAIRLARSADLGEVVVVMHEGLSDSRFAIHRGTRVRKMHSSRRDAFQSRTSPPLGFVEGDRIVLGPEARRPAAAALKVGTRLDARGGLVYYYPGLTAPKLRGLARGQRGLILAGTGLGHIANLQIRWLRRAIAKGLVVGMTTQCLAGEVDPYVYSTGRELLRAGVTFLGDLLPETAYVKLLWALGQSEDPARVHELLLQDRVGEFGSRRPTEVSP